MKRNALIIMMLLSAILSRGQLMQFQQAKAYFMDGNYYRALEYFNQAIAQERSGDRAMLTEAHYHRGLCYIRLHGEAITSGDLNEQKKFEDALLMAFRDFNAALGYDEGQYWQRIDLEMKNLHHPLLQEGLRSLNEYNDLVFQKQSPDKKKLARAEDYLEAAHQIRDTYLVNDLLGQVALDKGDKEAARKYFRHSVELYTQSLPEEPDFLMAYVFYRLAAINKTDSIRISMQDAERGIKLMESEYGRFTAMKKDLQPGRVEELGSQYSLAIQDLNNLKLDLYLSNTGLYVEALHVFEEELSKDPDNVDLLIAYASLLEKSDREKAIGTYSRILSIDSTHVIALFNLGAMYYSKGRELFELAQNSGDNSQFGLLMEEAIASFEKSTPYFEKALLADPQSLDTIRALKTIAFVLDDRDAYEKYQLLEQDIEK